MISRSRSGAQRASGPPLSALVIPIIEPAVALLVAALAVCEIFVDLGLLFWIFAAACVVATLVARRFRAARNRRALLSLPPTRVGDVVLSDLVERESGNGELRSDDALVDEVVRLLRSRRLVVLCGQPLSGRAQLAFDALSKADFRSYRVLRPADETEMGQRGLTTLLTSRMLWPRRYALWLGDLGSRLEAGLDPRIIERWLASGPGRVAVGWITPAMDDLIRETRISAAYALQRAAYVSVKPPPEAAARAVVARYRQAQRFTPEAAAFMRVVATCRLLRIGPRSDDFYVKLVYRSTGRSVPAATTTLAEQGHAPPLVRDEDGHLQPHPGLAALIDQELNRRIEPSLFATLMAEVDAEGLVVMAHSLAVRGQLDEAQSALDHADRLAPDDAAVADALLWLMEIQDGKKHGPTGATLGRLGGFDYTEPPGPEQERAARKFPPEGDGVFDPTLPQPECERWGQRFYRRTVRRAFVRVGVLMFLDFIAMWSASAVALNLRGAARNETPSFADGDLWALAVSATLVFWLIASSVGLYRASATRARAQLLMASTAVVSIVTAAAFFVVDVDIGSLLALPVMFGTAFLLSFLLRYLYDIRSRRWVRGNHLAPRVLLIGSPPEARAYAANMASQRGRPVQPVAYLSRDGDNDDPFCVGTYRDLEDRLHELHIAEMAIVDHSASTLEKGDLVSRAQGFGVDVRFVASDTEVVLGAVGRLSDLGLVHVPGTLISAERLEFKRVVDWLILVATLPAWTMLIALYAGYSLVRHRRQPLLVDSERVGLGQVAFAKLQLRTRTVHPDGIRGTWPSGRVEAFFEATGLDELPQVSNVLRGEMSLVGPRSLAARDVSRLTLDQRRTLGARPGMTGRWQMTWPIGASEADMRAVDADYLRRWRVSLDLEILLMTPLAMVLRGRHLGDTEIARRRGDSGSSELRVPPNT